MKARAIVKEFYQYFPKSGIANWDFVGYSTGTASSDVSKILTTLDVTEDVIDFAIDNDFDMIISHHPLFFGDKEEILKDKQMERFNKKLEKNKIVTFSAHTAVDAAKDGINKWALELFKPKSIKHLNGEYAQIGLFNGISYNKIVKVSKKAFKTGAVISNLNSGRFDKVMLASGSHDEETILLAARNKVDILITGELSYHDILLAKRKSVNVLIVGHFMENIFSNKMAEFLSEKININVEAYKEKNSLFIK